MGACVYCLILGKRKLEHENSVVLGEDLTTPDSSRHYLQDLRCSLSTQSTTGTHLRCTIRND